MDNLISRAAAIEALSTPCDKRYRHGVWETCLDNIETAIRNIPAVEAVPVVRCRDCKHRPTDNRGTGEDCTNFAIEFPDGLCPCQCEEDGWYNWYPPDDWFCANGEHREITQ